VNGAEPKIEIFKPFGEAFELTKKILFQPFDLKKWCVIGFAAFLSGHFVGGGFNFPTRFGNFQAKQANQNFSAPDLGQWQPWFPIIIVAFVVFIFALIILIAWLRSRGTFIFTDCIVRNRGAIVEPWREYRKEGNSYFLFQLAVMFCSFALVAILAAILIPLGLLTAWQHQSNPVPLILIIVFFFIFWIALSIFVNVVMYSMAPVMYRRRCRALEAFRDVVRLVFNNPVPFVLFCLFGIVLLLATIVIGGIATCATCCLAALPYVGTVILLPLFVCLRSFGLLFIRQFGPDYDVWETLSQPDVPPIPPPLPT
jgi:hypothetical protein